MEASVREIKANIMDEAAMNRTLIRLSHEIIEKNHGADQVVLVGVIRRGVVLAQRLSEHIESIEGVRVPVGSLDIRFHRDDRTRPLDQPVISHTELPFDINGKTVVLVDDVIYTGRTVRAAFDALFEHGRPAAIRLAVLIDRGLRELPIKPDHVGKNIPTSHRETVDVKVREIDGEDTVCILDVSSDRAGEDQA